MSTRLIGAVIMAHSDDEGLVLPPRVAAEVAAVIPIYKTPEEEAKVRGFVEKLLAALRGPGAPAQPTRVDRKGIERHLYSLPTQQRIAVDFRDQRPGEKHFDWEQRGVPYRFEVGPRDVDASTVVLKGRVDGSKVTVPLGDISPAWFTAQLDRAHHALFERAKALRDQRTRRAETYDELKKLLADGGGFVRAYFEPDRQSEARVKEETKATVRCVVPAEGRDQPGKPGKDIFTGKETSTEVLFAVAY